MSADIQVTILKTETAQKIQDYLKTRPYGEVAELIAALIIDSQTIKPDMLQPMADAEKEVKNDE